MKLVQKRDYGFVFTLLAAAIFFVVAGFAAYGDDGLIRLMQLKKLKSSLIEENKQLILQNITYRHELKTLQQPHVLANQARESLGWVYPDETVYLIE